MRARSGGKVVSATRLNKKLPDDDSPLDKMSRKVDQLPLLPQVLVRILQLDPSQIDYFDEIDRLAREDPPFAVRLLAMANSASSSPAEPITSIKEALTRIGAATIGNMVASMAVQRVFVPASPAQVGLWIHSVRVAVGAETLARMLPALKIVPGTAYLTGLLHDIGRFVMFEHAPEELLAVDESNWHSPSELLDADVEVFKYTHSELGYMACRHWGLPDETASAVRRHHDKLEGPIEPGSIEAAILLVEVADWLDVMIFSNEDFAGLPEDELVEMINQHCLPTDSFRQIVDANVLASRALHIKDQADLLVQGSHSRQTDTQAA